MVGLGVERDPELWRTLLRLLENAASAERVGARGLLPRFTDPNASWPVAAQILVWASSRGQLRGVYTPVGVGARAMLQAGPAAAWAHQVASPAPQWSASERSCDRAACRLGVDTRSRNRMTNPACR